MAPASRSRASGRATQIRDEDGFEFDPIAQTLAGAGYLAVRPNCRVSSDRGSEHSRVLLGQWGWLEVADANATSGTGG